jgi:hypothetical protein
VTANSHSSDEMDRIWMAMTSLPILNILHYDTYYP